MGYTPSYKSLPRASTHPGRGPAALQLQSDAAATRQLTSPCRCLHPLGHHPLPAPAVPVQNSTIRHAHENPVVQRLYNTLIGEPMGIEVRWS